MFCVNVFSGIKKKKTEHNEGGADYNCMTSCTVIWRQTKFKRSRFELASFPGSPRARKRRKAGRGLGTRLASSAAADFVQFCYFCAVFKSRYVIQGNGIIVPRLSRLQFLIACSIVVCILVLQA